MILRKVQALVVVFGLVMLAEFSWGQSGESMAVAGTVTYRQRMALPPNAIVDVQLQDVSG